MALSDVSNISAYAELRLVYRYALYFFWRLYVGLQSFIPQVASRGF